MPSLKRERLCVHRCRNRPRGGFTLIEVVFVSSVIAILIALLLPALGYAKQLARTAQGLSNLSQIGRAMRAYSLDYSNMLPAAYFDDGPGGESLTDWTVKVTNYVAQGHETIETVETSTETLEIFRCPNATTPDHGRTHYSTHPVLIPDISPGASPKFPLYSLTLMKRPSEVVLVMDGAQRAKVTEDGSPPAYSAFMTTFKLGWGSEEASLVTTDPDFDRDDTDNDDAIWAGPNEDGTTASNGTIRWRQHRDMAANFVFGDGHAATLRQDEVKNRNIRIDR